MTKNEYYIKIAEAVALKSKCLKKHYGAVIVNNDQIISTGYNGCPRKEPECSVCTKISGNKDEAEYKFCPAVHAEQNAIIAASRKDMLGSTLYLAGFDVESQKWISACPCEICLRLIKNAGIDIVINTNGVLYERTSGGILAKIN